MNRRSHIFKKHFFILLLLTISFNYENVYAQDQKIKYEVEAQGAVTTGKAVPFWMRSNQYGSIPLSGASASFIGRAQKSYKTLSTTDSLYGRRELTDWGFGLEGRANGGKNANLLLVEAYVKARLGIFQLKLGRSKDVMGLNGDTTLSTGNFVQSGNALGIPKVEISIPNYYTIPLFDGLFAFKGTFSHGWLGNLDVQYSTDKEHLQAITAKIPTYFHQKSLYVKIGKDDWRLKLYGGFNHQVFWGSEAEVYGDVYTLSPSETFFYVVTGKAYGNNFVPRSKIGNQLGSVDAGLSYDFNNISVMLYRQNFYDVGALAKLANIRDGLNGITIRNREYTESENVFNWKKFTAEFFYSRDQAGYPWSKPTNSGDEDYYNNYFYFQGWSYKGNGLGNPLITPEKYAREGQTSLRGDYFINNRVVSWHAGFEGSIYTWNTILKLTYSQNFGTFGTSIYGKTTGTYKGEINTNVFIPVNQFSMYLETGKAITQDTYGGVAIAADQGKLLKNSIGILFKIRKTFGAY